MSTKSIQQKGTVLTVIFFIVLLFMISQAYAAGPYSFSLDSFQVVGNLPGNLVDEFDDDIIDPWVIFDPTVVESGGLVTFSNPGTIGGVLINGYYISNEFTYLGIGWPPFVVENGSGDFTGISKWVPIIPGLNQNYQMDIEYQLQVDPHRGINISLSISNLDTDVADIFGMSAGLSMCFGRSGDLPKNDCVPVTETDITGDIILRLHFDDDTDQFTADFSLDGGLTFQNPFTPIGWGMETLGGYHWYFSSHSLEIQTMAVSIDIKPGSDPNSINPDSEQVISIAILTTDDFDATTIDPLSVEFGPNAAMESHGKGHVEDVDEDGDLDLVLHFRTQETGITCGDTEAGLTGETFDGQAIQGFDSINTVGCSGGSTVGTWDLIQNENGNAVPSGTLTLIMTNTTFDAIAQGCQETGTYIISGTSMTLTIETAAGSGCGDPPHIEVFQFTVNSTNLALIADYGTMIFERI